MQHLTRAQAQGNDRFTVIQYRRNVRRLFRRAAPSTVSAPQLGVHYMPFTHSVERWHA